MIRPPMSLYHRIHSPTLFLLRVLRVLCGDFSVFSVLSVPQWSICPGLAMLAAPRLPRGLFRKDQLPIAIIRRRLRL